MSIQDTAQKYFEAHREACEWTHGNISEVFEDENAVLCIRYEDGVYFHYKMVNKELTWF